MKRLMLLRHAKSAWDQPDLSDAERPLAKRGIKAAPLIGRYIMAEGLIPDLVLCSAAVRAKQTWDLVSATWPHQPRRQQLASLYMATPRDMLSTAREYGGDSDCILIVGHNPGIGDLAAWLVNQGDDAEIRKMREKFSTAALAVIDLPIESWRDFHDTTVSAWNGQLVRFVVPHDLAP
ncbi:MAG: histidine phosphatase family protein [Rhodospirillaceae bacterium]|nr:MAG: histidine phosphatase family protein [Rhodospirillaceae bacterium]